MRNPAPTNERILKMTNESVTAIENFGKVKKRNTISLFPSETEWGMIKEQAKIAISSGLLPQVINTAEKAIVIALKGRELGIPPFQAFSHINIIQGKPEISAELMLALIYKNCKNAIINYIETNDKICVLEAKRLNSSFSKFSFSLQDASKAGLLDKGNWAKYPAAMLRARAISSMARAVFPDAIMGCYVTGELMEGEGKHKASNQEVKQIDPVLVIEPQPEKDPVDNDTEMLKLQDYRNRVSKEIKEIAKDHGLNNSALLTAMKDWAKIEDPKRLTTIQLEEFKEYLIHDFKGVVNNESHI